MHSKGSLFTALLVYVDDMVITGNDHAYVASLKSVLDQKFGIKDLGSFKYFLGLELQETRVESAYLKGSILWKFLRKLV